MKINTKSVLTFKDRFIKELKSEELDKATFSVITSLSKYKKALNITELDRTNEEIATAYVLIEKAISDMETNKTPILVDNLLFAIAYPESFKLVRKYYDTLTTTCLNSKKFMKFDGEKFSPFQTKSEQYVISRIKQLEQSTYTLFFPLFENQDFLNEANFDKRAIENMYYKNRLLRIGENTDLRDKKIAYEIYTTLLSSNETLESICKTYQIGAEKVHQILKDNLKEEEYQNVLDILKRNTLKRYYEINHTIELLYDYIPNGITRENGIKMPFTMLDYYSITYMSPSTILEEIEKKKPSNKEEAVARAISKKYLHTHKKQGPFINKEMLISTNMKIIRGNEEYSIVDYADELLNTFKKLGIPCYKDLLELAFSRITKNQPIFPLSQKEENMKMSM